MSANLLAQARAGDRDAFAALVEPHRSELLLHCYRMLGSFQDAEDALQETLLAAWLGLPGFEGRSSVRTWLYRVATNRCLNMLRSSSRRPVAAEPLPVPPPEPSRLGEVAWLQPFPDALLSDLADDAPGPDAQYESREAISLAFITAVQLLPPNQRAALLLRDVLGYHASEAADILGSSEDAVNSALKRARAALAAGRPGRAEPPAPGSAEERDLLERFVSAFTVFDVDAILAMMSEDAWLKMPPLPFEYYGIDAARRFFDAIHTTGRRVERLIEVRANGQPAFGAYRADPSTGLMHNVGLFVLALAGGRISEIVRFESGVAALVGLPRTLT